MESRPRSLEDAANALRGQIGAFKAAERNIAWYPYDTLANAIHIDRLLGADAVSSLSAMSTGGRSLDVGTGDGDWAFLLERLGFPVEAVDHSPTNNNSCRGFQALREALSSQVHLHDSDIDAGDWPGGEYGLCFALGVLYHLKNPQAVLEALARKCRYAIISTRVFTRLPGIAQPVEDLPIGYLVDADELNADDSNFWLLTPFALDRLVKRAKWRALRSLRTDPVVDAAEPSPTLARDERMFLLLESSHGLKHLHLHGGWGEPEGDGWRWTGRQFAFGRSDPSLKSKNVALRMALYCPECWGPLHLTFSANGEAVAEIIIDESGPRRIDLALPPSVVGEWRVDCTVDRTHTGHSHHRDLGLVVGACDIGEAGGPDMI